MSYWYIILYWYLILILLCNGLVTDTVIATESTADIMVLLSFLVFVWPSPIPVFLMQMTIQMLVPKLFCGDAS